MDYRIEYFEKFNDSRGELVVFLRKKNLSSSQQRFGQIYFVTFAKKNTVRGNHYHKKLREWFGIVDGRVQVFLKDVKTGKQKKLILNANSKKYIRLEIGPGIIHSFKSLTNKAALLNYTQAEWSASDSIRSELIK